jgi:chromosome segregation ATPase
MSNDVVLLLAGAGISLVSSLATTVFTALLNYWLDRRAKTAEKAEQTYNLIGKISALIASRNDQVDPVAIWEEHLQTADEFLRENKRDPNILAAMIGFLETESERTQTLLKQLQTAEEENYMLKEKVGLAEAEHSRLEEERSQLEEERSQLEEERSQLEEERSQLEEEQSQLGSTNRALREQQRMLEEEHSQLEAINRELKEQLGITEADEG